MENATIMQRPSTGVGFYVPDRGLKAIAAFQGIEKHWARAKNLDALISAVTEKLRAQAEFAEWWDRQEKNRGGGNAITRSLKETGDLTAGKDGIPSRKVLHAWRQIARDLDKSTADAIEKCRQVVEADKKQARLGTGNDHWYTPPEYIERARSVLGGIDLDPATSDEAQQTIRATRFFTEEDNGLNKDWLGRVWLNPPYSRDRIAGFTDKMVGEYKSRRMTSGVMLTHNCTDTEWFQNASRNATALCFTSGRISFIDTVGDRNSPTQGQTFFYFGREPKRFAEIFDEVGIIVVPFGAGESV